jgi:stress-induced morphogen
MQSRISSLLSTKLKPTFLDVINESSQHARGNESHFKVIVVSNVFDGISLIDRHRMVNDAVQEVYSQIHALSIIAKTPEQWNKNKEVLPSPPCLGGSKHDKKL